MAHEIPLGPSLEEARARRQWRRGALVEQALLFVDAGGLAN
jgi:hypothetical protein